MKNRRTFAIAFIFLFAFTFAAISTFAQPTKKRSKSRIRGDGYTYNLYDEDFVNTPKWNIEAGEPPVSISRAVELAKANLPRFVKSSELFKVSSIHLRPYLNSGKWYYAIRLVCRGKKCRDLDSRTFSMLVKMNENVIEPKILPPGF